MAYCAEDRDRRAIVARWSVTADLTMTSASQIGSFEGDHADTTFGRDRSGRPILYGTTLAGALRSALDDICSGYRTPFADDRDPASSLFGSMTERESPAIVYDSVAREPARTAIRDGVAINPSTRTAADKAKYDREIALPGIVFPIRVDVVITEGMDEPRVMADLANALGAFNDAAHARIRLGARKTRGMGACEAGSFRAIRYTLGDNPEGWRDYAKAGAAGPPATIIHCATAREAISRCLPLPVDGTADRRNEAVFAFLLNVRGSLIIRSPGLAATDPDNVHLSEAGAQLVSGTSLAGALRSHAARILATLKSLNLCAVDGDRLIRGMFGPPPGELRSDSAGASHVVVEEVVLCDAGMHRHTRVKIDRFTGGAVDTALFEERPGVKGSLSFSVRLLQPSSQEIGLMALVARDLVAGLVPIGGEAAVGRGVVTGEARMQIIGSTAEPGHSVVSAGAVPLDQADCYVASLIEGKGG